MSLKTIMALREYVWK